MWSRVTWEPEDNRASYCVSTWGGVGSRGVGLGKKLGELGLVLRWNLKWLWNCLAWWNLVLGILLWWGGGVELLGWEGGAGIENVSCMSHNNKEWQKARGAGAKEKVGAVRCTGRTKDRKSVV